MKTNQYPLDNSVSPNDFLLGSDAEDSSKTKNYRISKILALAPQGNIGPQGPAGQDGLSAYQIAVNNGFVGTEEEWLASLQGQSATASYKVLSGSIYQTGTGIPVLSIRESTFDGGFTWSRQSAGRYSVSSDDLEITDNYLVFITPGISNTKIMAASKSGSTIAVRAMEIATGTYADELNNVSFELRVYPTP